MNAAVKNYPVTVRDGHVYAPCLGWYLDVPTPREEAFISHAHRDHFAPHLIGHCTLETAVLLEDLRDAPKKLQTYRMHQRFEKKGYAFTFLPAGHIPGSAQLLLEADESVVLFSGDVRLSGSRTCPAASTPRADLLIMEGTYVEGTYRHLTLEEAESRALSFLLSCKAEGAYPVFVVMSRVGKAQDLVLHLGSCGYVGALPAGLFRMTESMRKAGVALPSVIPWKAGSPLRGDFMVVTRSLLTYQRQSMSREGARFAFVSGWAADRGGSWDARIPMSDHADTGDLITFIERVSPQEVWTFADRGRFAARLRKLGIKARSLD